jgi:MFS transporter, DHA2 family, multidrug resistance protein
VAIAGQLPQPLGAGLLRTAREAFTQSVELATGVSAIIALATAILAVVLLRNVRASTAAGSES